MLGNDVSEKCTFMAFCKYLASVYFNTETGTGGGKMI